MVKELMEKGHEQSCVISCDLSTALCPFALALFWFCFCHLVDLSAVSRRVTDVDKVLEWLESRSWSSRNLGCKIWVSNKGKDVRRDLR